MHSWAGTGSGTVRRMPHVREESVLTQRAVRDRCALHRPGPSRGAAKGDHRAHSRLRRPRRALRPRAGRLGRLRRGVRRDRSARPRTRRRGARLLQSVRRVPRRRGGATRASSAPRRAAGRAFSGTQLRRSGREPERHRLPLGLARPGAQRPLLRPGSRRPARGRRSSSRSVASRLTPHLGIPSGLAGKDLTHDAVRAADYDRDPLRLQEGDRAMVHRGAEGAGRGARGRARAAPPALRDIRRMRPRREATPTGRAFFDRAGSTDKTWNERKGAFHEVLNEPDWRVPRESQSPTGCSRAPDRRDLFQVPVVEQ